MPQEFAVTKKVRCRGPGRSVRVGYIELTIDVDAVATSLAQRAFWSKGKRSRCMHGSIVGKVIEVQEEVA